MKKLLIVALLAQLTGCAAFCNSEDQGCINKMNAVSAGIAAVGVATLGAAAAYEATRPQVVYVRPAPVYVCNRWGYCHYVY